MVTPHLIQYQGSKRNIASQIIQYFPKKTNRLIEPFCGTAAISILAAQQKKVNKFILNDINGALIDMLEKCINEPEELYQQYEEIWNGQFAIGTNNIDYFYQMRDKFNKNNEPALMLFMLARVVKGAVRYNNSGQMNQSCDNRRNGTKPAQIKRNAHRISNLLKDKTEFYSLDYKEIFNMIQPGDLVYMDPPYQGTSNTRDGRYYQGVNYDDFVEALKILNERNIDYIISYDGITGEKKHGKYLPKELELTHILINAGKSSQATLLRKKEITYESLYLSKNLRNVCENRNEQCANRAKSWACEHCSNWELKEIKMCKECYYAYPEEYLHIAGEQERKIDIVFKDEDIKIYEFLKAESERRNISIQEVLRDILVTDHPS